jgi:hypothetical protein
MVVLRRRMDGIQNEQRAAQHHRERLDKVVHDEVIPSLLQMSDQLEKVDLALRRQMARLPAKPEEPDLPFDPAGFNQMRDDLLELARELELPADHPVGVKVAARTGGRRLLRVASRHIPAHARRRQPPG